MAASTQVGFRWIETHGQGESLAVALGSLCAMHGLNVPYDEWVGVLGLGNLIAAAESEPLGNWPALARDRRLSEVAQAYGITLRPLHPPAAARGLSESREFGAHFCDSYLPLISRALAVGQVVLNWRGWPPPREPLWGVITEQHDDVLAGFSLKHRCELLPLIGPAHQCYVVEEFQPPTADRTQLALFQTARHAALANWTERPVDEAQTGRVRCGAPAWEAWIREVAEPSQLTSSAAPPARQISDATAALGATRRTQASWLRKVAAELPAKQAVAARDWAAACEAVITVLTPWAGPDATRGALEVSKDSAPICAALMQAFETERAAIDRLREAADCG